MLTAENWCIKVDEKVYGPYSTPQMRKFAHEGRLATWSLVSHAGSRNWREAREEQVFANFFGCKPKTKLQGQARKFGRRIDQDELTPEPATPSKTTVVKNGKQKSAAPVIREANFVIVFDVVSAAASRVEAAIHGLGTAFRLADNVWSVKCDFTAVGVRNAIAPYLAKSESIFVVDATRGKSSWQNYPPEPHSKISASYLVGRHE